VGFAKYTPKIATDTRRNF